MTDAIRGGARSAVLVLGFFAILFAAFYFRAAPLILNPVRTTHAAGQFDTARALERLSRVLDGTPHPVDSDAGDQTRARLVNEITALGYQPQVVGQNACRGPKTGSTIRCAYVQNVFFKAGTGTGPALVLTAHYDSVDASPGFADDGIGVAVWLEVAHLLKQTPPNRPVLFLLTDGEETALLGAQAFIDSKEKYAVEVGRIINLEARGVRGPAMMFETGHPNSGIVTDWSKNGARPAANSMLAAVYEFMPNSTDLTAHLQDGSTGINIAMADGLDFYHTAHDDLAHLDRTSVQHMGDQALGATRAYLASDWSKDRTGGEIAYSDIGTRLFVALPEMLALGLLGLCLVISAILLVRPSRESGWKLDWRALVLPPALAAAAGLLAFLTQLGITFVRPEPAFWSAYPQALNMAYFAGAALVAAAAVAFLAPNSKREALFASGWFWFLLVGMGLSLAVHGFSMIFLIPGFVFMLAGGIAWLVPRLQLPAYIIASVVLALIFFPIVHLLDVMMGLGMAAAFGVIEGLLLAPMIAIAGGLRTGRALVLSVVGAAFVAGIAAAALVPAYSVDRPLALSFNAHYVMDEKRAALYANAAPGALPKVIRDQLTVGDIPPPVGSTNVIAARKLDFAPRPYADAALISDTTSGEGKRVIRLQLTAPGARSIRLRIPAEAHPTQLTYDGSTLAIGKPQQGYNVVEVVGRAANGATLEFTLEPAATAAARLDWLIQGIWTELPPEARALAASRPDTAVRIGTGDTTITTKKQPF